MISNMSDDNRFSGGAYVAPQGGLTLRDRLYLSVRASTESALRLAWQAACENRKAGYRFRVGRVQGCNPAYDEAPYSARSEPTPSLLLFGVFESYENVICK